jgi:hypothetical protein
MNIIRLGKKQKKCSKVDNPILKDCPKGLSDADIVALLHRMETETESREARDELVMGLIYIVKVVVGRFLYHWPVSRRFEDDMVSTGFQSVIETIDKVDEIGVDDLRAAIWTRVQDDIEEMLNDGRSTFGACARTNRRRVEEGAEPEYIFASQLREELDSESFDLGPEWVDMMDEIEHLKAADREHVRYLILRHMSDEHGLDEDDLTDEERDAVDTMSKIFENL